jgi:hypothetical protein
MFSNVLNFYILCKSGQHERYYAASMWLLKVYTVRALDNDLYINRNMLCWESLVY